MEHSLRQVCIPSEVSSSAGPKLTQLNQVVINHLPTTRGTVTLASADPADSPVIDHNHLDAEADRHRLRVAVRTIHKLMNSPAGREMVVEEAVPEGFERIKSHSTDEAIDARVRQCVQ